ncbi:hypothetical protein D3C84_1052360 [compost metagenome]
MPLRPAGDAGGIGQDPLGAAVDFHFVLQSGHGALLFQWLPVEASLEPVHQRENQVEVVGLHQVPAMVQFVQPAHVADPGQVRDRVVGRQVFAGVEDFVAQVAGQQGAGEQGGDVAVEP